MKPFKAPFDLFMLLPRCTRLIPLQVIYCDLGLALALEISYVHSWRWYDGISRNEIMNRFNRMRLPRVGGTGIP